MSKNMTVSSSDGMVQFELDEKMLQVIENALGSLKSESRKVLKNAVNATAKQAKSNLAAKAQEVYVPKKTRFTKVMDTKNATTSNPTATINITDAQMELKDFKVSPATYKTGGARPDVLKAKVKLASSLKSLVKSDIKAFLIKFQSGHVTVAQRQGAERLPVKKLLSNSVPKMIGNQEAVYGVVEPHIYSDLMDNIRKEIKRVVG